MGPRATGEGVNRMPGGEGDGTIDEVANVHSLTHEV